LKNAYPGSAGFGLESSVNTGTPVAASSVRENWVSFVPLLPSCTYSRVLPLVSLATAIEGRDWISAAFSDGLICVQVAAASFERQTPRAY
jgi:hypothetical protein